MAYEMSEYLTPPVLCRAQTDPSSTYESRRTQPASPPPTYEEVMKEVQWKPINGFNLGKTRNDKIKQMIILSNS
jgi:hypothetical protein